MEKALESSKYTIKKTEGTLFSRNIGKLEELIPVGLLGLISLPLGGAYLANYMKVFSAKRTLRYAAVGAALSFCLNFCAMNYNASKDNSMNNTPKIDTSTLISCCTINTGLKDYLQMKIDENNNF